MSFLLALVLAWAVERAAMYLEAPNMGVIFNGWGCIDAVNARTMRNVEIQKTIAYRVCLPWIIWLEEKLLGDRLPRQGVYIGLRWLFDAIAIWSVGYIFGLEVALVFSILALLTFRFDYWDWTGEITGVMMACTGNLPAALAGGIFFALSRETAPIVAVVYFAKTRDWIGSGILLAVTLGILYGVHAWADQGMKPDRVGTYERFVLGYNNFYHGFREIFKFNPVFYGEFLIGVIISILGLIASTWAMIHGDYTAVVVPLMILAGWTMSQIAESRILVVCLPWISLWILRGV